MIKLGTFAKIYDNSGVKLVKCFHLRKKKMSRQADLTIGEIFLGGVLKYDPQKKIKKKEKIRLIIVLDNKKKNQGNGHFFKTEIVKTVVLATDKNLPYGNRIKTKISRTFKKLKYKKR